MNNEIKQMMELRLYSRKDLSSKKSIELRNAAKEIEEYSRTLRQHKFHSIYAERIVRFISAYDNGLLGPERCDVCEPIRETFDPNDITLPVEWLSQVAGQLMLKRNKPIKYLAQIENRRRGVYWISEKGKPDELVRGRPDPLFLTFITFWLNVRILRLKSVAFMRGFLRDLFDVSEADYGYVGMQDDVEGKNLRRWSDGKGKCQQFTGNDPEYGLPGIYWINIFGKAYVDWFGRDKFANLNCFYKEEMSSGAYLAQTAENPYYFRTAERVFANEMINYLSRDAFFDIEQVGRKCRTPFDNGPMDKPEALL